MRELVQRDLGKLYGSDIFPLPVAQAGSKEVDESYVLRARPEHVFDVFQFWHPHVYDNETRHVFQEEVNAVLDRERVGWISTRSR